MLPIDYAPFNGIYSVRPDQGPVLLASHCDMRLLQNYAEASSWVRGSPDEAAMEVPKPFLQTSGVQQQQRQLAAEQTARDPAQQVGPGQNQLGADQGGVCSQQPALRSSPAPQSQARPSIGSSHNIRPVTGVDIVGTQPAAGIAAARITAEVAADSALTTTAPAGGNEQDVKADDSKEEESQAVPPPRRRTKQSVAQRMHSRGVAPDLGTAITRGKTALQKVAEAMRAELTSSSKTAAPEPKSPTPLLPSAATVKTEAPVRSGGAVEPKPGANQRAPQRLLNPWDHDSDDDLFVDLSGCNILPPTAVKKEVKETAASADSKQSAQTRGNIVGAVTTTPGVSAGSAAKSRLSPASGHRRRGRASSSKRDSAGQDADKLVIDLD